MNNFQDNGNCVNKEVRGVSVHNLLVFTVHQYIRRILSISAHGEICLVFICMFGTLCIH